MGEIPVFKEEPFWSLQLPKEPVYYEVRAIGGRPGQSGLTLSWQCHPSHRQTCNFNTPNKFYPEHCICQLPCISQCYFVVSGILSLPP